MPLYEYQCKKCKHRFEKIQKYSDPMVKKCPECGGPVEQMISAPAVQFKGSGWYVTDYAGKKTGSESSSSDKSDKSEKSEQSEKSDKAEKSDSAGEKKEAKPKKTESKKSKD
ncbi:MAG: transcriptional regulator [Candidatus Angelobacter sp. Gp1-AA117]|nr:MAG: transcriptional regulator [Candidatus Angelobacter sp. Gp1-AA117]